MEKLLYLDNAATTSVKSEVLDDMLPYYTEYYGNPSSVYGFAQKAKTAIEDARRTIADFIGAGANEIYFTGGGSESDNWALKSAAYTLKDKGRHIITSRIEHHAVLHTCEYLEKNGFEISYIDVDENGIVRLDKLKDAIREDTILISVMFANNEIGTIQPVKEIGRIAREHGILFHTDAVQAFGHIRINVEELNIDMLSASAHKLYGPKGVGIMYLRKNVKAEPFLHGGAQERNKRAGTHNVPGIVGMASAVKIADAQLEKNASHEAVLRDYLIERVMNEIPYTKLNGDREKRLPNNANFSFRFIEGESMLMLLDREGICCSSGSACTSGSLDPSHVLLAIGLPHEIAHGSLRVTLSDDTKKEDIDYLVNRLKDIVKRLRSMSPLYDDFIKSGNGGENV